MTDHPVLQRLTNLKEVLRQLEPLDEVVMGKISKMQKRAKSEEEKVQSEHESEDQESEENLASEGGEEDLSDDYASEEASNHKPSKTENSRLLKDLDYD